jgi:hypothetical protein
MGSGGDTSICGASGLVLGTQSSVPTEDVFVLVTPSFVPTDERDSDAGGVFNVFGLTLPCSSPPVMSESDMDDRMGDVEMLLLLNHVFVIIMLYMYVLL